MNKFFDKSKFLEKFVTIAEVDKITRVRSKQLWNMLQNLVLWERTIKFDTGIICTYSTMKVQPSI